MKFYSIFAILFFSTLAVSAQNLKRVPHLNYVNDWNNQKIQVYGSLSENSFVSPQTFSHGAQSVHFDFLNSLRFSEFSTQQVSQSKPSQVLQFKSQYVFDHPRSSMILLDDFWSQKSFESLAGVVFEKQGPASILAYDLAGLATVRCVFQQKIINKKHSEWKYYQQLASIVSPQLSEGLVLEKIIVQTCTEFSHLMTHNLQFNFLYKSTAASDRRIWIIGYNQAFVKEESMGKLKLGFLWSGVEKGLVEEMFSRFVSLVKNVSKMMN